MNFKITVYSKPDCTPCRLTKQYFDVAGLQFSQGDIEENIDALRSLGFSSAPVILVESEEGTINSWSGFRPDLIKKVVSGEAAGNASAGNEDQLRRLLTV